MAVEITWPTTLDYDSFSIGLDGDGDIDHVSIAGRVSTLERTSGAWRGSFTLAATNKGDDVRISARWLMDMFSSSRFCAIPLAGAATPPAAFSGVTIDGAPKIPGSPAEKSQTVIARLSTGWKGFIVGKMEKPV